jgi:hypothetical protein
MDLVDRIYRADPEWMARFPQSSAITDPEIK